jgi:hypothetical protein
VPIWLLSSYEVYDHASKIPMAWRCAAPESSACAGLAFLTAWWPAAAMTLGAGQEGVRKGVRAETSGDLATVAAVGKGAPVGSPRPG